VGKNDMSFFGNDDIPMNVAVEIGNSMLECTSTRPLLIHLVLKAHCTVDDVYVVDHALVNKSPSIGTYTNFSYTLHIIMMVC
jgi:hypothetical protein